MLITTIRNEDPMKELILTRFLNNRLIDEVADLYEVITGDDIFEVCADKPRANCLLAPLLPLFYPKKKALKEYNRMLHQLMSGTVMTADPVSVYLIRLVLGTTQAVVKPACPCMIREMEGFLDSLKKPLGLPEEVLEKYKTELPEILGTLDQMSLIELFRLGHYDNHLIDALTKQELKRRNATFKRTYTMLEDYLEAFRVQYREEEEKGEES